MRERSGEKKAVTEDMRDNEQGADITLVLFEAIMTRRLKRADKVIWRQSATAVSSLYWTQMDTASSFVSPGPS